jgi:hypothetical protein
MPIFKIAVFLITLLQLSLPAAAEETKSGDLLASNRTDFLNAQEAVPNAEDHDLVVKQAEFDHFASNTVKQFNRNLQFTKEKLQIIKLADGSYLARYHQIDETSFDSSIRRSQSKSNPFVGILSYREHVYEAHGESPASCNNSDFSLVQVTPNRHIFSYSKGTWR